MEHCLSDHCFLLLWAASSQWAFCLIGMFREQLWSARDLAFLKFSHEITMLPDCHLLMPQCPVRGLASVTISLRGTGTWAEPLAMISLLEDSRFHLHSQFPAFGPTANSCTKVLTPDWTDPVANPSGHSLSGVKVRLVQEPKDFGETLVSVLKEDLSPQGEPPHWEQATSLSLIPSASPHLEANSSGSRENPRHPCKQLSGDAQPAAWSLIA